MCNSATYNLSISVAKSGGNQYDRIGNQERNEMEDLHAFLAYAG